jgi:DNA segregation ATPase FtsK/SpoIIIE, S-DNA-T family
MNQPSILQTERDVIQKLEWLFQFRAAEESRIVADFTSSSKATEESDAKATAAALRTLEESRLLAQRTHDRSVTAINGEAGDRLRAADAVHERAISIIDERAAVDSQATRRRYEESAWMADTVLEAALPRIREQHERAKAVLSEQAGLLQAVRVRAESALHELGGPAEWLRPVQEPVLPEGDALGAVTPLVSAAAERLPLLERAALLKLLRDRGLFGFTTALLALGVGAGVGWLALPRGGPTAAAIAGGVIAGATVPAMMAARRWAAGAVRRRAEPLALSIAAAERAISTADAQALARRAEQEAQAAGKRDREVRAAKQAVEETLEELKQIHNEHRRDAGLRHEEEVRSAEAERAARLAKAGEVRERDLADAERAYERASRTTEAASTTARAEATSRRDRDWASLESRWHDGLRDARAIVGQLGALWTQASPQWSSDDASLTAAQRAPRFVPIGGMTVDLSTLPGGLPSDPRLAIEHAAGSGGEQPLQLQLPVGLEFPDAGSLAIRFGGATAQAGRTAAIAALRVAMLRLMTSFPPGKVRFTIIDPVGLGESFAAFMHLADYDAKLVGDKIWTESRHIEQRLADLTEHMETVIQKYLRNQFATIDAYNEQAGEIAEPYRFLVIADFPSNFSEAAARRLASIAASGPRCGVYVLMAMDGRQAMPAGVPEEDVLRGAVKLSWRQGRGAGTEGRLVQDDSVFAERPMAIDPPPVDDRFNALVRVVGAAAKDAGRVRVPFGTITPREGEMWSRDSSGDLRIAMGRAGATRLQDLTLGRGTSQHALIAGRTGSGKSTLLHAVITNAALWYGPDQLELYLIDFKKGVEFKTYATNRLPHARVIAVESEREFGLSVLRRLDAELKQRGELYRAAEVQDLAGFRRVRPGQAMPRIMLIVDEFQELFVEDDRLAQEASLLLDRLVRQGRAFGMHVVLGSQTLGGAYSLAKSTIGQMAVRIALQCSEQDSYLILSDDNAAARLLARPGEAIYNDASGAVEGNSPFQVAWLDDDERDRLLETIRARDESSATAPGRDGQHAPSRALPIVFEGSVPADIARNTPLAAMLGPGRSSPGRSGGTLAFLGEPVAIKDPTAAVFKRQAGSNVLILGQNDDAASAMLVSAMIALSAQLNARGRGTLPSIWLLDGTPADAPGAGTLERLARELAAHARVVGYRELEAALGELTAELDRRVAGADDAAPGSGASGDAPVFLIAHGLQRFRVLRRPESEFDFSSDAAAARADQLLARLLREGPAVGLHVIATCDTLASLNRVLDRQGLREFDQRVLFQMSSADSSALIDSPVAGQIGPNRALLYSEEQGTIEKFRPYAMPSPDWLERTLASLRGTSASA